MKKSVSVNIILFLLSFCLVLLKLNGNINWHWVWVFSPIWIPYILILVVYSLTLFSSFAFLYLARHSERLFDIEFEDDIIPDKSEHKNQIEDQSKENDES